MQRWAEAISAARPKVVAALAARLRDLDLAEDAFADATAAALTAWPLQAPRDPAGCGARRSDGPSTPSAAPRPGRGMSPTTARPTPRPRRP